MHMGGGRGRRADGGRGGGGVGGGIFDYDDGLAIGVIGCVFTMMLQACDSILLDEQLAHHVV